ncbi:MAG: hypothetical protein HYV17_08215 [Xanthomonadales bacterium]|nr:hypothetical protein [Xanthomonadales bacterium]
MNATLNRLLALSCALAFAVSAAAGPTDLDTSFGGSGDLLDPFVSQALVTRLDGHALAVSSDQLTYIVGGANGGAVLESAFVGVLNANGSIATHLNGSGYALLPNARFEDLVLLPDGKVLACGLSYVSQTEHRWLVARFNADLSLDTTLAGVGYVVGALAPLSVCHGIEQLSNGRIAITGAHFGSPGFVAVMDSSGILDPAFGDGDGMINNVVQSGADISEAGDPGLWITSGFWFEGLGLGHNFIHRFDLDGTETFFSEGELEAFSPRPASSGRLATNPMGQVLLGEQDAYRHGSYTELRSRFRKLDASGNEISSYFLFQFGLAQVDGNGYQFSDTALLPDGRMMMLGQFIEAGVAVPRARVAIQRVLANMGGADYSFHVDNGAYLYRPAGQADGVVDPLPLARSVAVGRNGRITVLSRRSSGQDGVNVVRFMGDGINNSTLDLEPAPMVLGAVTTATGDLAQSNLVAIDGLPANVRVPLFVLGGEYKLNSGSWQRHPTYVKYGDFVRVRGYASATPGQQHTVSLFVGGLRGKNSWDAIGNRQRADFVITSATAALAGQRCSDNVFASGCSQAIPDDGNAITSELPLDYALAGDCNYISRVRVGLDIDHPYLGDLKVTLLDPNYNPFGGEGNVVLLDRVRNGEAGQSGSCTADGLLGNVGDDATASADAACAATGGSGEVIGWVRPSQPLTALAGRRGTNANGTGTVGTWTLVVRDLASTDAGQLNNWSIAVECTDTAPSDELFRNSFE